MENLDLKIQELTSQKEELENKIKEDENPVEDLPLDTSLDNDEAYEIDDLSFEI